MESLTYALELRFFPQHQRRTAFINQLYLLSHSVHCHTLQSRVFPYFLSISAITLFLQFTVTEIDTMVLAYEEEECPGDSVPFLVNRLQFKYQAQLPGSSEGTYHFRIHETPDPHAYRILRVRSGLPQEALRFGTGPSTKPELAYSCTITFQPFSSILDGDLTPVVKSNKSCVDSVPHEVDTDSAIDQSLQRLNISFPDEPNRGSESPEAQSISNNADSVPVASLLTEVNCGSDTLAAQASPNKADIVLHDASTNTTITSPKANFNDFSFNKLNHLSNFSALKHNSVKTDNVLCGKNDASTITSPEQISNVPSCVSHDVHEDGETDRIVHTAESAPARSMISYEPAPVAFGRIIWDYS